MPGPGPHLMYAMVSGIALTSLTNGKFSRHHTLVYAVNAFFGPDIGSFAEWLASFAAGGFDFASDLAGVIHHPLYYVIILGLPLSLLYSWLSSLAIRYRILDSFTPVALSKLQCIFLVSAGSLSHFFLDHLFEENGRSDMYMWILSTGWWLDRAPINPDAVVVVGVLCASLIGGFIYINRVKPPESGHNQTSNESLKLVIIIATLYCIWCASQIYLVDPRRAAVGEEADLGVLVFLATYLFFPHFLLTLSMHTRGYDGLQIPK